MVNRHPTVTSDNAVIDPSLAIDSMRQNGYLSTDTAIAELIDNGVEAKADLVELFLFEDAVQLRSNVVQRITKIGVLDNGIGMDAGRLQQSLRFGGGDRYERRSIGRFGFGLPNSSISQASTTTVWSWQNGPTNALMTYLDVDEIREGTYKQVPDPELHDIPAPVKSTAQSLGRSGTYVEWTRLDPDITWKRGKTVIDYTEALVGRVYRYFISGPEPLRIRMVCLDPDAQISVDRDARPNDPLYLMGSTACPWQEEPMFQEYTKAERNFVGSDGHKHPVTVVISYARPEARREENGVPAGKQSHGQHAFKNQGVSIVRANRELELADIVSFDPYRDRWLGAEVRFPPQLDELFGVLNNKQSAPRLARALRRFSRGAERVTVQQLIQQGDLDPDEEVTHLYRLAQWMAEQMGQAFALVKKQREGTREGTEKRYGDEVEDRATKAIAERSKQKPTPEEEEEQRNPTPPDAQREASVESFTEKGLPFDEASALADIILDRDRRLIFVDSVPGDRGDEIFDIENLKGARVEVVLNGDHPAYRQIYETLRGDNDLTEEQLRERMGKASDAMKMLFAAWARMEMEAAMGPERRNIRRIREDWGRMAWDFLEPPQGDPD